jgi:hypothetical protein
MEGLGGAQEGITPGPGLGRGCGAGIYEDRKHSTDGGSVTEDGERGRGKRAPHHSGLCLPCSERHSHRNEWEWQNSS